VRYITIRGENRDWFVVDMLTNPPRILCNCVGWYSSTNADRICEALNKLASPIDKLILDANGTITET